MTNHIQVVQEFQRLFYMARRHYRICKQGVALDVAISQEALTYAAEQSLVGAEILTQASNLEGQGSYQDAMSLLDNARSLIEPLLEGIAYHLRGVLYHSLARSNATHNYYEEAIQCYRRSLSFSIDNGYVPACQVWTDLAQAYGDVGVEHYSNLMEESYGNVIDFDEVSPRGDCSVPGRAWIRIAQIYVGRGNTKSAIKAYLKAAEDPIVDPLYEVPSAPWLYVGREHFKLGEYKEAIEACNKSLMLGFPRPAVVWILIGKSHYLSNNNDEAKNAFEQAIKESQGFPEFFRREAERLLEIISSGLQLEALNADDRANFLPHGYSDVKDDDPSMRILRKIDNVEQDQYEKYLKKQNSGRDDVLSILRGWSSAVTLVEGSERLWRGGGYMIKWRGRGIVLDPGFDFLRNLHDAGYHGREIDAVVVSHNHPDHNADLTSVDDLRYEIYKRCKGSEHEAISPYALLWDNDTQRAIKFSSDHPEHMLPAIVFNVGLCNPEYEILRPYDLPVSIRYFTVKHGDLHSAVGFKVILHAESGTTFTLGYTGDTEFFPDLAERLADCDILLAHISQPSKEEFTDPNARKKVHLGYRGLAELIKHAKPRLTLVGEFWGGLADLRIDLVQGLRHLTSNAAILPTGIGMHISLPTLDIECSACRNKTKFESIRVGAPTKHFENLTYLCPDCFLN